MGFRQRRIFEKYLTKFVLGLFLWERQTWRNSQAGRQVLFYPTVGSDLLSSPPARTLHLSQRHLFPFFPALCLLRRPNLEAELIL